MAVMPTIQVTWCPNPLRPASERETLTVGLAPGDSLQAVIERLGLAGTPISAALNGRVIEAQDWPGTPVRCADMLVLRQMPQGIVEGSTVAAKLVMGANVGWGVASVLGTVIAFAANAAIAFAISSLANSLARKRAGTYQADDSPAAYGIEGGSNTSRPYEPLPLVLGEHRIFPDYAGRPFAEYVPDPSTATEVINDTPQRQTMTHAPFSMTGVPPQPVSPWTLITSTGDAESGYTYYYGDNAERTYTSSSGGTVTRPHTFVVRRVGSAYTVATYEDYLILAAPAPDYSGGS